MGEPTPCGGCGAQTDRERCMGCFHDFGTPESEWVRVWIVSERAKARSLSKDNGE